MKQDLKEYSSENVEIYELPEGIKGESRIEFYLRKAL